MPRFRDLSGLTFGRLTVVSFVGMSSAGKAKWTVRCACGRARIVVGANLTSGSTSSCGCTRAEKRMTHGMTNTPTYRSWASMLRRCTTPTFHKFASYGAAGVTVCGRWRSFESFLSDMGERPAGTTLDRIDNAKGYEPGNCRWATPREQCANRRNTVVITYQGRTAPLAEWSRATGILESTLYQRVTRYGWTAERALTAPVRRSHHA